MADITFYKNIPFAPDGSFTMDFLTAGGAFSEATRTSYLEGTSRFYTSIALGDSVYIRDNVPFRVPYNIDALRNAGVNYFRFRNIVPDVTPAVYSRYYYGFIDKMTLAAADTTEIEWHIDPLQTYLSEIYSEAYQQKIERCHQDRYYKSNNQLYPIFNTLPDMPAGARKIKALQKITVGDVGYCVLICSSQLGADSFDNSIRVGPPDVIQGCPNSFYYYIFPVLKNYRAHYMREFKAGNNLIFSIGNDALPAAALFKTAAPRVVAMYYTPVPPVKITWTYANGVYTLDTQNSDVETIDGGAANALVLRIGKTIKGIETTSITQDGFAGLGNKDIITDNVSLSPYNASTTRDPLRESKLYTSDYVPIYFTDYSSAPDKLIKNELISAPSYAIAGASFSIVGIPTIWVKFANYNGDVFGPTDYKNDTANEIPIVTDTFSEYFSRNSASSLMSLASVMASGLNFGGVANSTKIPISYSKSLAKANASAYGAAGMGFTQNVKSGISGGTDLIDVVLAPDTAKSVSNAITPTLSRGYYDFLYYYEIPVNAVEICDFWALYGYPYNKPAKLSDVLKTRNRFNYVKTTDATLISITYAEHKRKVEALFDAGVTFWHDRAGTIATIGDYSKENAETTLL